MENMTLEESITRRLEEIQETLVRTYTADQSVYTFRLHHVRHVAYATLPVLLDYHLFANVEIVERASGRKEAMECVAIKDAFLLKEVVPFGKEYYQSTYDSIFGVIGDEWRNYWTRK